MKKQYVWAMVATLGLAGCGGGGGGGSDDPGATTGISVQDLVGNWIRTETTYDTNAQGDRDAWSATYHDTIIITRPSNGLNLRNCITDGIENATLSNKELTVGETTFTVVDKNTMTHSTEASEIVYRRMQTSDRAGVGRFDVSLPLPPPYPSNVVLSESQWKEFCAASHQFASGVPVVEFKGVAAVNVVIQSVDVVLRMKFDAYGSSPFAPDTYIYPSNVDLDVSGEFVAPDEGIGGDLYSPLSGSVEISSAGGRLGFLLEDLEMPSDMGGSVVMSGSLSLPAAWLEL